MKTPGIEADRIGMLKANYEELLGRALLEDRQRANFRIKLDLNTV